MSKPTERDLDSMRVNPNPRLIALLNFALDEIAPRLHWKHEYSRWLAWASLWKGGRHSPAACVEIAHICFKHEGDAIQHCLGQLAWGAKEACYSGDKSGWLVVRYIADAMLFFGAAFPESGNLLERPPIEAEPEMPAKLTVYLESNQPLI